MPADHGLGLDKDQDFAPARPYPAQRDPEPPIRGADAGTSGSGGERGELLPKGSRVELPGGKVVFQTDAVVTNLRVSRKGDKLAFLEYAIPNDDHGHVVVIDLHSGKTRTIGPEFNSVRGVAFSADEREVWVTGGDNTNRPLHGIDLATGADRIVFTFPGEAVLSDVHPDGRVLVAIWNYYVGLIASDLGGWTR